MSYPEARFVSGTIIEKTLESISKLVYIWL